MLKAVWIFMGLVCVGFLVAGRIQALAHYAPFFLCCIAGQALFLYSVQYRMYHFGRMAFLQLRAQNPTVIANVGLTITGFDLWSQQPKTLDVARPIYQFESADIIVAGSSLILLGKSASFGGSIAFASPVEIATLKRQTSLAQARLLEWSEANGRVVMKIQDVGYTKPVKIAVKDHLDELRPWLASVRPDNDGA